MRCPVCTDMELVRTPYEGIGVNLCPACHGFLLSSTAMKGIERNPEMQQEVLESETQIMADSIQPVVCPKCRITMQKKNAPHSLNFNIDVCRSCNVIWLDAGELESIQLAYEASSSGQDNIRRRKEMENMSEERKLQLQKNINKAPDHMSLTDSDNRMGSGYGHHGTSSMIVDWIVDSLFHL
jgi:Zn-finger nucleic acid-binding protein